jgi:organic hydroperoxide reductase OsmC/OhrA
MSVDVKYRTSATATGGRDGQTSTADGSLNVKLSLQLLDTNVVATRTTMLINSKNVCGLFSQRL